MGYFSRLKRAWSHTSGHNTSILAAGVAFYAFLALVPLLASIVLCYSIIADPVMVAGHIEVLAERLPQSASDLIAGQLESIVETSSRSKGFGLLLSLLLAVLGVRSGANTLIQSVGTAFERAHERSFLRANLLTLAASVGAVLYAGVILGALFVTSALTNFLPELSGAGRIIGQLLTLAVVGAAATLLAALLYRIAPHGIEPSWHQVFPGAALAGFGILLLTASFGFYVANFGNYNATYGSLGAVVVLLTWLYVAAFAILFGAEVAAVKPE